MKMRGTGESNGKACQFPFLSPRKKEEILWWGMVFRSKRNLGMVEQEQSGRGNELRIVGVTKVNEDYKSK